MEVKIKIFDNGFLLTLESGKETLYHGARALADKLVELSKDLKKSPAPKEDILRKQLSK